MKPVNEMQFLGLTLRFDPKTDKVTIVHKDGAQTQVNAKQLYNWALRQIRESIK